ncbi:hypothetical protein Agub_g528 [Astrephomene gubernaculifera]|uniref:Uncharacterized protein n=1 Tax=Astrephomene gubernaculifera TaxID=47775 RepID=A0AAD3HG21_9CHLO|nr:hypothetical protein Agub_g528 [Astrephomene gubernaculifera]
MSRIDYSKWDNIDTDTDSEEEEREAARLAAKRAAAAAAAKAAAAASTAPPQPTRASSTSTPTSSSPSKAAPSTAPAAAAAATPKLPPRQQPPRQQPAGIPCTYGPSRGDPKCTFFTATTVPPDHRVFTQGALSPIAMLVGLPLRIWRLDPRPSLSIPRIPEMDNQRVTYLMIDPFSGFAPPEWQQGIGSVILARQDRKPLPPGHVEAFWMFIDRLLGLFSEGDPVEPAEEMTPARWREFYEQYREGMLEAPARKQEWLQLEQAPWEL